MKRRNAELGKMRRPMKRNKITEGFYGSFLIGSVLFYAKFLVLWALVILADFILDFRFEFLWPFYLLLRSVCDSYRYQGIAFSAFFVCIALTSDILCYLFIPVDWLVFAASTYVWVQYVWHTDKGICTPTIILWILFVYIEAGVRLRDVKHLPGHLDLCRPFAAHCIGYPVVTLGFGFKSYVGYRMRQRKQRDVVKENEFYMQLLQQALPLDAVTITQQHQLPQQPVLSVPQSTEMTSIVTNNNGKLHRNGNVTTLHSNGTAAMPNGVHLKTNHHHRKACKEPETNEHSHSNSRHILDRHKVNNNNNHQHVGNGVAVAVTTAVSEEAVTASTVTAVTQPPTVTLVVNHQEQHEQHKQARRREKKEQEKEREAAEYLQKVETDARRLRVELQSSRASEQELRLQVAALTTSEKVLKGEISAMQREIEDLQQRFQSACSSRTSDKQSISNLERKIAEERRTRCNLEQVLNQLRKTRKQEEARAAQVVAQCSRGECTEACIARRRELECELSECRKTKHWTEERYAALERESGALAEQLRDNDILMTALSAMQEKNTHLENSLSAETRIKLDLFSALGEAKRQLEIRESSNRSQEREIQELKSKIAQVLAVMPNDSFNNGPVTTVTSNLSRVRLAESPPGSTLDPNATAYTPKGSLVASTEA